MGVQYVGYKHGHFKWSLQLLSILYGPLIAESSVKSTLEWFLQKVWAGFSRFNYWCGVGENSLPWKWSRGRAPLLSVGCAAKTGFPRPVPKPAFACTHTAGGLAHKPTKRQENNLAKPVNLQGSYSRQGQAPWPSCFAKLVTRRSPFGGFLMSIKVLCIRTAAKVPAFQIVSCWMLTCYFS
jgi:hypothetical protein